jgi:hypothetical protein
LKISILCPYLISKDMKLNAYLNTILNDGADITAAVSPACRMNLNFAKINGATQSKWSNY